MYKLLPWLILATLLSACGGNKQSELVTEYYYDQYGRSEGKKAQYMAIPGKDDLGFETETRHGSYKAFYRTGELREKAEYKEGNLLGTATTFYKDGQVAEVSNWKDGQFHGIYKYYAPNGTLVEDYVYENGALNGTAKSYFENGQLKKEIIYKDDLLWNSIANYDSAGNKLDSLSIVNGDGLLNEYYPNGQLAGKTTVVAGDFNGPFEVYHENGKPQIITNYLAGKKHGTYQSFFESGQLETHTNFHHDINIGVNKLYSRDGVLIWETEFKGPPFDRKDSVELNLISYGNSGAIGSLVSGLDPMGTLRGIRHGMDRQYHSNGKLKSEALYLNNEIDSIFRQYDWEGKLIPQEVKRPVTPVPVDSAQLAREKELLELTSQ